MITLGIASIPQREASLEKVLDSLTGQVDQMNVCLNGYDHVPEYLHKYLNAWWVICGNKGDQMKFLQVNNFTGFYLTADDDIIYPQNYVQFMVSKVKEYGCPCSMHGKVFEYPVANYHRSAIINYHCRKDVLGDHVVDTVGTGVLCFKISQPVIAIDDFKLPNMADLWFSKACREQNIPLMVVAHKVTDLQYLPQEWTIWGNKVREGDETRLINEIMNPK